MKLIEKIDNISIVVTNVAFNAPKFSKMQLYMNPHVRKVQSVERKDGKMTIKCKLPNHKDGYAAVIPEKYITKIVSCDFYENFTYPKINCTFPVYIITLETGDILYTVVDNRNEVTFFSKEQLFNSLENTMLSNLDYIDEL